MTQLLNLFRSRICIVSRLLQTMVSVYPVSFWNFVSENSTKLFLVGLKNLSHAFGVAGGKREEAWSNIEINDEPLTCWRVVFTFLCSKNVQLQPNMSTCTKNSLVALFCVCNCNLVMKKINNCRKLHKHGFFPFTLWLGLALSPTLLPKNWFGNFPWGQTFLSQSLLLS